MNAEAKAGTKTRPQLKREDKSEEAASHSYEGEYDEQGFYIYADGSFVDPDGYYFDRWGYDELGGHYDDNNIYHPPEQHDRADDYHHGQSVARDQKRSGGKHQFNKQRRQDQSHKDWQR